jgi:regulator of sigma D
LLQQKIIESTAKPHIDQHIKQWLLQRQTLLVLYSQVCVTDKKEPEKLRIFCQTLMDYLSTGHFQMFEKIAEVDLKRNPQSGGLDSDLLSKISVTTDIALDFNDKYTEMDNLEELSLDLSHLGENLAHRMDWEDKLIKSYIQAAC